ncbi:MAG: S-layer homology domain-containing protein [Clostridia bacterium]|nr:S-layer homology domain-containing protein [Clostridia bacterium]
MISCILTAVLALSGTAVFADTEQMPEEKPLVYFHANMFDDVSGQEYYYDAVEYAVQKGLMTGMGENQFSPDLTVTRAQLLLILWNLSGRPDAPLSEETDKPWYSAAAAWGSESGVSSYETEELEQPITRGEMGELFYRYAGHQGFDIGKIDSLQQFSDADLLQEAQGEAMGWLVQQGIVEGYPDGTLKPEQAVSRGDFAVLLYHFCQKLMPEELQDVPVFAGAQTMSAVVMDTQLGNFWAKAGEITASDDIERVIAVTWCAEDQSDMSWKELELREDGSYGGLIQAADHQFHFGTYTVDFYLQLSNGMQLPLGRTSVLLEGKESQARVWTQVYRVYDQAGWDLYSCYNWVVQNTSYQKLPIPLVPPEGYTEAEWYALQSFELGQGNCYCYAAAFYYLALGLGYDAHFIQGQVGLARGGYGPHGWVIINIDGSSYICDPESQDDIGRYNFYMQPAGSPVLRYRWE